MSAPSPPTRPGRRLRLHTPAEGPTPSNVWRINGWRATVEIWSVAEVVALGGPPAGAQLHPLGVWVALRVE